MNQLDESILIVKKNVLIHNMFNFRNDITKKSMDNIPLSRLTARSTSRANLLLSIRLVAMVKSSTSQHMIQVNHSLSASKHKF